MNKKDIAVYGAAHCRRETIEQLIRNNDICDNRWGIYHGKKEQKRYKNLNQAARNSKKRRASRVICQ